MLCYRQGNSILYCAPCKEILLWYFTKEDKCQFVLPDPPFVHQSGESTTSNVFGKELRVNKAYICVEEGSWPI